MKNYICLLLTLLIFISLIAACGENENNSPTDKTEPTNSADATEAVEKRPPLGVPKIDYGGYKFRILTVETGVTGHDTFTGFNFYSDFIDVSDRVGEPINDSVFARNLQIKEDYNVEIVATEIAGGTAGVYSTALKFIASSDDIYDIITPTIDSSFALAQEKYLYNLYEVPFLELNNPWWDQALVKNLSLNNKLFTITGDISMSDEELNWCIIANKFLMEEYQIPNLYNLVREGKWTIDRLHEIGVSVTRDLNGDGVIDWNDLYAFGNGSGGGQFFYFSTGENIAVLDKEGYPQLVLGNERAIRAMDRIVELYNDRNFMIWAEQIKTTVNGYIYLNTMFIENRVLFNMCSMYEVKEFRNMVDDFAILPGPKYDEAQDDYYMIQSTHACMGICIPVTNPNLERTGIVLEAMAYHSKPIQEAYYDITLTEKFIRDKDSRDMLEIIFGRVTYDIGKAFGWGSYTSQIVLAVQRNTGFAALFEANKEKALTEIEKSFNIFLEAGGN